jgi:hypothetical protein
MLAARHELPVTPDSIHARNTCFALYQSGLALLTLADHADGWWTRSALNDPLTSTLFLGVYWLRDRDQRRLWPGIAFWLQWKKELRTVWLIPRRTASGWSWSSQTNHSSDIEWSMQIADPLGFATPR